jgi:hypothetical protein
VWLCVEVSVRKVCVCVWGVKRVCERVACVGLVRVRKDGKGRERPV